jgi:DNA-binding response OmpR family regulator
MQTKILLVEDDPSFGDVLSSYLEIHHFNVNWVTDGEKGLQAFKQGRYDLCIFDVMMPKMDGFTLAKHVKTLDPTMPIIFLTAKTLKDDVISGFKIGADDYISKPFNSEELLLRINAVLKRNKKTDEGPAIADERYFEFGHYHFDSVLRLLTYKPEQHQDKLSPKEAELLKMFCERQGEVLTRTDALKKVWGEDNYFTARSMDVFITKLRKYIERDKSIELVNIHGSGFQLSISSNK